MIDPDDAIRDQDRHFMALALEQGRLAAAEGEVPVGAVLVRNGEVIGQGFNCPISRHDPTAHAEVVCLRDAARRDGNYRLPGTTLYVTVEPCTMCAGAIVHARIERLVFGCFEPRAGSVCSNAHLLDAEHYNHSLSYHGGVLAEEASELMRQFFRERRERQKALKRTV